MRQEETGGNEKGLRVLLLQLLNGPRRQLVVSFVLVAMRKRTPVNKWMSGWCLNERRFGTWSDAGCRADNRELVIGWAAPVSSVKDLTGHTSGVAVLTQESRQGDAVLQCVCIAEGRRQPINTAG